MVDKVWSCATCGEVLHYERLDHQVGDPEPSLAPVGVSVLNAHQLGDPAGTNGARTNGSGLDHQLVDPALFLLAYARRHDWTPLATRHGPIGGDEDRWRKFLAFPPPWLPEVVVAASAMNGAAS